MTNPQEEFWAQEFGTSYTARNRVDWKARVPFWRSIIVQTKPDSILEVGANAGWNLRAIREVNPEIRLYGVDVNPAAVAEANEANLNVFELSASKLTFDHAFDLVTTVGLLIHVGPNELRATMRSIADASRKYVLAVEYAADEETELNYRGHAGRLWKRPFGRLYEELGLTLVAEGNAPAEAFDRCHYWLLQK